MIIGVLELASKYKYGLTSRGAPLYLFKPYDPAIPDHVVGCSHRDTTTNQIAIVETSHQETGSKIRGLLHRLIGPVGDLAAEKEALLLYYNPAAKCRVDPIPDADQRYDAERQELSAATGWLTFHVDPPGCRDVDDALAYHPATGRWAITIADVAAAVPESCEVDASAAIKGTSFYDLEGRVLTPMLPAAISEGSASLLPGSRKRGLTLFLDEGPLLLPTWITVDTTYTYGSVLLSPIAAEMQRAFGGSDDPHKWIESAMILYNAFVAAALAKAGSGLLRVQPPSPDLDAAASHPSLAHLLQEAATYETTDVEFKAHTSLGLPVYCHATSPLRRYADLVNQRVLHSIRTGATAPLSNQKSVAVHLNERTKAARRFGRDLTFLTHVTPGRVHEVAVIVMLDDKAYVPLWNRVIRIRHFMSPADNVPGAKIRIHVYCDPTQRNWKQRILTAAA
jgi:exoribonuclease R